MAIEKDNSFQFGLAVAASLLLHAIAGIAMATTPAPRPPPLAKNYPLITLLPPPMEAPQKTTAEAPEPLTHFSDASFSARHAISGSEPYYQKVSSPDSSEKVASDLGELICAGKDANYEGVGMIIQPGSNRVISAPEAYPAYKAGIRLGDRIADPYGPSPKAGIITFDVETDHGNRLVRVRQAKICFK